MVFGGHQATSPPRRRSPTWLLPTGCSKAAEAVGNPELLRLLLECFSPQFLTGACQLQSGCVTDVRGVSLKYT